MTADRSQPGDGGAWVRIFDETEDYRFNNLFRVIRARLQFRRFDGRMSEPITRINFERGDSVGILLHDPQEDTVVLVRQFRYPVYARLTPDERDGSGAGRAWLLEIVAGIVDEGLEVGEVARRELLEEAGYAVEGELHPIGACYPSPGGTSERVSLFMAEVACRRVAAGGGGIAAEGEDIQVVVIPFAEALDLVARGEIQDAKTIIALQHLALVKAGKAGQP